MPSQASFNSKLVRLEVLVSAVLEDANYQVSIPNWFD